MIKIFNPGSILSCAPILCSTAQLSSTHLLPLRPVVLSDSFASSCVSVRKQTPPDIADKIKEALNHAALVHNLCEKPARAIHDFEAHIEKISASAHAAWENLFPLLKNKHIHATTKKQIKSAVETAHRLGHLIENFPCLEHPRQRSNAVDGINGLGKELHALLKNISYLLS